MYSLHNENERAKIPLTSYTFRDIMKRKGSDEMAWFNVLKALREASGKSMSEAADALNIAKSTYASYEYGKREPNIEMLTKIANFYGVTTDYLLGRDSQKSNELTPTQREEIATQKWLSLDKEKRDALLQMMETCIKTFEAAESDNKE